MDYGRYLASREWALLREAVRRRSRGRCERCPHGRHDETHHLTYERIGHERLEDLLGVCRACHAFLSGKSDVDPAAAPGRDNPQQRLEDGAGGVYLLSPTGGLVYIYDDPGIFWRCAKACGHDFLDHGRRGCRLCACAVTVARREEPAA